MGQVTRNPPERRRLASSWLSFDKKRDRRQKLDRLVSNFPSSARSTSFGDPLSDKVCRSSGTEFDTADTVASSRPASFSYDAKVHKGIQDEEDS